MNEKEKLCKAPKCMISKDAYTRRLIVSREQ